MLLLALLVLVVLPLAGQGLGLITDAMWFDEVGYRPVFLKILSTTLAAGALAWLVTFVVLYLNLRLVRRGIRPELAAIEDEQLPQLPSWTMVEPLFQRLMLPGAVVVAFLLAGPVASQWPAIIRYLHAVPFGVTEPLFGRDVGFYVFAYPLLTGVVRFLSTVTLVTLVVVGGVYVLARSIRLTPQGPLVIPFAKGHLLALGAAFLLIKAWGYGLDRYNLLFSAGGAAFGASYTDVRATLPALNVLIFLAGLAAIACLLQMTRPGLRLAFLGVGLWVAGSVVGLTALPSLVQRFVVAPNEIGYERPYIERTIAASTRAYGLDQIQAQPFPADEELTAEAVRRNDATIRNVRVWDHRPALDSYGQLQAIRTYYRFTDVDNDRYQVDGQLQQVMLSVRELSHADLPSRIWINEHLVYTHGHGAVVGPVNRASREGLPEFFIKDIPSVATGPFRITRPEVYYGELANPYILVRTGVQEFDYPVGDQNVYTTYAGQGGVGIGGFWRRVLFALRFREVKFLLARDLTAESRILYHRQIDERVQKIAPFLRLDRDPYPVLTAEGRLVWLLDAYTTSEHVPYSQPTRGIGNYIRNPVKVTVDAYDGTVRFYLVDPGEPLIRAYASAFPGLFQPIEAMPADLRAHIRYPQDLFDIQARMYAAFHMQDPQVFYNKEDLWTIPTRKGAAAGRDVDMEPYYTVMRLPGETKEEFILLLPYTPVRRDNLIAWLAARSDPPHYGKLILYEFPKGKLVFGPRQVEARIDQDTEISQQITLWSQAGSQVLRGSLLAIPIEGSLIYVQPLYLAASQGRLPELKRVIAAFGNRIAMEETLEGSLGRIFGAPGPGAPRPPPGVSPLAAGAARAPGAGPAPSGLAAEALDHFTRARDAFGRGNWSEFASQLERLETTLKRLREGSAGAPRPGG